VKYTFDLNDFKIA